MKKTNWIIAGAFALGLAIAPQATAHAADGDLNGSSTASFVAAPGQLTLVTVPDMNFGTTNVKDLIDGTSLSYVDGKAVTTGMTETNANQTGQLQVADYRGTSAGWQLTAKAAAFTADHATVPLNVTNFSFGGLVDTDHSGTFANPLVADQNIYGAGAEIWNTGADTTGTGTNTVNFTAGDARIDIAATGAAVPGTYQSQITWTLASAPDGQGN